LIANTTAMLKVPPIIAEKSNKKNSGIPPDFFNNSSAWIIQM
jgi:hypothetical protein